MKLVKQTSAALILGFFAFLVSNTAQAQIKNLTVQDQSGNVAIVNPDLVTAEFLVYQQEKIVHLVDLSTGPITKRIWDMGDGAIHYDKVFFSHSYKELGLHKICLTVTGPVNSDTDCHKVIVR